MGCGHVRGERVAGMEGSHCLPLATGIIYLPGKFWDDFDRWKYREGIPIGDIKAQGV